jgi:uncharacterized protein (DUF58 family)
VVTDLALLSRLRFVTRRRRRGGTWGERRSTRRGQGVEFADYRDYTPGDDPRRVDWKSYARLDRPYVRLYEEEEDLSVSLLLDGSASMGWGAEEGEGSERWRTALALARALGAVALLGGDLLGGALLREGKVAAAWALSRGRASVPRWEGWLAGLETGGPTELGPALRAYASRRGRPGLVLLLTDGYDPQGLESGVAALAGRGHEVALLHILTPAELAPDLEGDLRLVDVEGGEKREVTVDGGALAAYEERLAGWRAELRALLGRHGGRYVLLRTDLPVRRLLLEELRRAAILR